MNATVTFMRLGGGEWGEWFTKNLFIVLKSFHLVESGDDIDQDDYDTIQSLCQRNCQLQKHVIHTRLVDIVIAMSSLDLPPYVILEIVDKFEYWSNINRKFKIDLIIAVDKSCKRVRSLRQ